MIYGCNFTKCEAVSVVFILLHNSARQHMSNLRKKKVWYVTQINLILELFCQIIIGQGENHNFFRVSQSNKEYSR